MRRLEKGDTKYKEHELRGRSFLDCAVTLTDRDKMQQQIMEEMPSEDKIRDAIFRLVIDYPRDWEALIDEPAIRRRAQDAFEFHFIRRPHIQARLRLRATRTRLPWHRWNCWTSTGILSRRSRQTSSV